MDNVIQADRIEAAKIMISREAEQLVLDGKADRNPVVQAFARHRLATARPDAGDEDVERVALLREAASLAGRIEAAGHVDHEHYAFEAWKKTARDLAPRLRAAAMREGVDRGMVERRATTLLARMLKWDGSFGLAEDRRAAESIFAALEQLR